ncbi:uncharacterized protein [Aristolochia californica]|uniref:uncharacterized protein n=1 Tax=Aristolochia californica TaxID=171875 RepID=UPI0035D66DAE
MTELKRRLGTIDLGTPFCAASVKRHKADGSISARERKEKIGEKVAALQQLVSPFGKTDTASVLQEAAGYIKFLQDQVQVRISQFPISHCCRFLLYCQLRSFLHFPHEPIESDLLTVLGTECSLSAAKQDDREVAGSGLLQLEEQRLVLGACRRDGEISDVKFLKDQPFYPSTGAPPGFSIANEFPKPIMPIDDSATHGRIDVPTPPFEALVDTTLVESPNSFKSLASISCVAIPRSTVSSYAGVVWLYIVMLKKLQ